MNNQIILEKLQTLQSQIQENIRLRDYVESGLANEVMGQLAQIKETVGELPKAPAVAASHVQLPLEKNHALAAKNEKEKRMKLLMLVGGVTALLLIIYFISNEQFLNTLSVIGIFATIAVAWFYKISADAYKKKAKEYDEAQKKYQESLAQFHRALQSYGAEQNEAMKLYTQYELRLYENYPTFMDTAMSYETKQAEAMAALDKSNEEIMNNDVIATEYLHLVPSIISMLKSGRADSYKEALNMAIEEERQDAIEAARREEEERRIAAMERQAEEERRHNMAMEHQQAEHDRAMERAEQDRAQAEKDRLKADERARKSAAQADSEARRRASQQCMVCAKRSGCRNPGIPGCGAFVPRNY